MLLHPTLSRQLSQRIASPPKRVITNFNIKDFEKVFVKVSLSA